MMMMLLLVWTRRRKREDDEGSLPPHLLIMMLLEGKDDDAGGRATTKGLKKGKKEHRTEWLRRTPPPLRHSFTLQVVLSCFSVSRLHPLFRSQGCCFLLQCLEGLVRPWDPRSLGP